jgi:glyoxylase-like metal-dependent hydrolase (beta-lactamase superfamily II)
MHQVRDEGWGSSAVAARVVSRIEPIAPGVGIVDLGFQGLSNVVSAIVIEGPGGIVIVDPGPASTYEALGGALEARGLSARDVRTVLLTHIHLDHAGAAGTLVRDNPAVQVHVHHRGAPHIVDPTRLLDSAARLYGPDLERLWGRPEPVAASNVHTLAGGERLDVLGRAFEVAYTPGHASHHVSFFDRAAGLAFVGDAAGITIGRAFVMAPTPPPEVDLAAWDEAIDRMRAWHPDRLVLAHFGTVDDVGVHFDALRDRLRQMAAMVKALIDQPGDDADRAASFARDMAAQLERALGAEAAARYQVAVPLHHCWLGLARYWRKQGL